MGKKERQDLMASSFTLILGIMELILSLGIQVKAKNGDVGSAFLPQVVGGMMVILSLIYLVETLLRIRKNNSSKVTITEEEEKTDDAFVSDSKKIYLTFVLLIVYAALLKPVGFILMSMIYLFLQMNVMSEKPTAKQRGLFAVLSIIVPIIVYYLFVNGFSMILPQGILG